jgi:hypothetical protein
VPATGALVTLRDADGGPVVTNGHRRGTSGTVAPPCPSGPPPPHGQSLRPATQERLGSACGNRLAKPNQRMQLTGRATLPREGFWFASAAGS